MEPDFQKIQQYISLIKKGQTDMANRLARDMTPTDVKAAEKAINTPAGDRTPTLPADFLLPGTKKMPMTSTIDPNPVPEEVPLPNMGGRKIGLPDPATLDTRIPGLGGRRIGYPQSVPRTPIPAQEGGGAAESAVVDQAKTQGRNPSSRNLAGVDQVDPGAMVGSGKLSKPMNFLGDPSAKVSIGQALLGLAGMLGDAIGGAGKEAYLGVSSPTRLQQEYQMRLASQQQANQIYASMEAEIQKIREKADQDIAVAMAQGDIDAAKQIKISAETLIYDKQRIAAQAYVALQNNTLGRASLPGGGSQMADSFLKGAGQGAPTP